MTENRNSIRKPVPERLEALRNLPKDILESLSKEELMAFLHDEEWPKTLQEKLKDYLV